MDNQIDGTDGKLGRGFMSADKLEEIDIGDGDKSGWAFGSNLTVRFGSSVPVKFRFPDIRDRSVLYQCKNR
jgi:hypothetical protein